LIHFSSLFPYLQENFPHVLKSQFHHFSNENSFAQMIEKSGLLESNEENLMLVQLEFAVLSSYLAILSSDM